MRTTAEALHRTTTQFLHLSTLIEKKLHEPKQFTTNGLYAYTTAQIEVGLSGAWQPDTVILSWKFEPFCDIKNQRSCESRVQLRLRIKNPQDEFDVETNPWMEVTYCGTKNAWRTNSSRDDILFEMLNEIEESTRLRADDPPNSMPGSQLQAIFKKKKKLTKTPTQLIDSMIATIKRLIDQS